MFKFFCAVCIDDFDSHPVELDRHTAMARCPVCNTMNKTSYANPDNPTEEMLTLEEYNRIHGLDNTPSA